MTEQYVPRTPEAEAAHQELLLKCEQVLKDMALKDKVEFAEKVGKVMDDLRSSHVFFILQQAYGDMDWEEAQAILDKVKGR